MSIVLKQRHTWVRSRVFCDYSTITSRTAIGGGSIDCVSSNCWGVTTLAWVNLPCVAFNVVEDFSVAEGSTIINLPANITIEAGFRG